jgi:hypothetical protein
MVRRDGLRIRCFTRNGHDRADRFTGIAPRIKASSLLIHGEAVITRDEVLPSAVCRRRWCCPLLSSSVVITRCARRPAMMTRRCLQII